LIDELRTQFLDFGRMADPVEDLQRDLRFNRDARLGLHADPDVAVGARILGGSDDRDERQDHACARGLGAADLEVRCGDGDWSGLHCERLTVDRVFPVASPTLAADLAADPARLANHRLLHTIGFRVTWPRWLDAAGLSQMIDASGGDHFDPAVMSLAIAERGLGVALSRTSLAGEAQARGTLVAPFETALATDEVFFLVWPTNFPLPPDVERFVEWLRGQAD
jgi:DNA-binding transcriptional LysR family regulator